jgi:putative transposase
VNLLRFISGPLGWARVYSDWIRRRGQRHVQLPKLRDRLASSDVAEKIRFTSNILPKWARRSISLDALLPILYLKGNSTGDFQEALSAIMGPDTHNVAPSVISRLTAGW